MGSDSVQRGAALLAAVMVTLILSILGTVSLNLAAQEIQQVRSVQDEIAAHLLAEAGLDLIVQGFHAPSGGPTSIGREALSKRYELPEWGPSFFDATGRSQFSGTSANPDVLFDARNPEDNHLLNDEREGWLRTLGTFGQIRSVKVYRPSRPGLLCTLEASAQAGGINRTLTVQLGALMMPPIRAGVQISNRGSGAIETPLPVWLHWGDLKMKGNVNLGPLEALPAKAVTAVVTGQSYSDMGRKEDRWLDLWIGGEAIFTPPPPKGWFPPPNLYVHQDPVPGLRPDEWDYATVKKYAQVYGVYYAPGPDGLLYRNGNREPGLGLTPEEAFRSESIGDNRGLVFIDTLDQRPPNGENLASLTLETEYGEGLFVVNAHVHLKPKGNGQSISAWSPPAEEMAAREGPMPVKLSGVHLQGVLYTVGDLSFEGKPRIYGALIVGGKLVAKSGASTPIEVWYDHDLGRGLFRGLPLVYMVPGTWQERY